MRTFWDAVSASNGGNGGLGFSVGLMSVVLSVESKSAGSLQHFEEAFSVGNADAALGASVFHYNEIKISELKQFLQTKNILVRI